MVGTCGWWGFRIPKWLAIDGGMLRGWYGKARDINSQALMQWAGTARAHVILLYVLEGVNGVDAVHLCCDSSTVKCWADFQGWPGIWILYLCVQWAATGHAQTSCFQMWIATYITFLKMIYISHQANGYGPPILRCNLAWMLMLRDAVQLNFYARHLGGVPGCTTFLTPKAR